MGVLCRLPGPLAKGTRNDAHWQASPAGPQGLMPLPPSNFLAGLRATAQKMAQDKAVQSAEAIAEPAAAQPACNPGWEGKQDALPQLAAVQTSGWQPGDGHRAGKAGRRRRDEGESAGALARVRRELLRLEEEVPWDAVKGTWKARRKAWCRTVRTAVGMGDLAACIAELRDALAVSGSVFAGYGGPWDCELQRCLASRPAPPNQVYALWLDFRRDVRARLGMGASAPSTPDAQPLTADAIARAVAALQAAALGGQACLAQCPVESIVNYDAEALALVRRALENEQALLSGAAAAQGDKMALPPSSYWPYDEGFDSGGESDGGSDVTVMSD